MKRKIFFILFIIAVFIAPAWAHKVNLFCYLEGNKLYGESYFSGGKAAQKAKVEVYDDRSANLIATALTDKDGRFWLTLEEAVPLKVKLYAGQGHKTEIFIDPENNEQSKTETTNERKTQVPEPSFVTILGGLGWIIGIFGLFYLWKRKNAS